MEHALNLSGIWNGGQLIQKEGTVIAGVVDHLVSLLPSDFCPNVSLVACGYRDVKRKMKKEATTVLCFDKN